MTDLPEFDERGFLPEGIHPAKLETVLERFADSPSGRRRKAGAALKQIAEHVAKAGVSRLWVAGGFVTDKPAPGDLDVILDTVGLSDEQREELVPYTLDNRAHLKKRYPKIDLFERNPEDVVMRKHAGAEARPILEWFQQVKPKDGGGRRGIVEISLVDTDENMDADENGAGQ